MQMANPQLGQVNYTGASTSGGPGLLGDGMYSSPGVNVNLGAYNNALGSQAAGQLSSELGNFLPNTTAPAMSGNMAGYNAGMQGQLGLANQYQQMAAGNGPSLAALQAQQSGAQNLAATESMLGSARGAGNPAAAQSAAAAAQSQGQQQIAQNAVAGRTQEELGALQGAAGLYGNIAGQGLQQQGLGQNLNISNQANNLAANNAYMNQLGAINQQQQYGQIQGQNASIQAQESQNSLANNAYQASAAMNNKIAGQVVSTGESMAALLLRITMSGFLDLLTQQANRMIDSGKYKSSPAKTIAPSADVVPATSELPPPPVPDSSPPAQNLQDAGAWNDSTNLPPAPPPHVIPSQKDLNRQDDADTQRALINGAMTDMGNQVNPAQIQYFPSQSLGHLPTPEEFARMLRMQQQQQAANNIQAALDSRFKK